MIFQCLLSRGLVHVIVQLIEGMKPVQFSFYFAVVATCSHRLPVFTESVTIRFENLNIERRAYPVNKISKNPQKNLSFGALIFRHRTHRVLKPREKKLNLCS